MFVRLVIFEAYELETLTQGHPNSCLAQHLRLKNECICGHFPLSLLTRKWRLTSSLTEFDSSFARKKGGDDVILF
ncbi:uncharacterized protein PHALS_07215 [Plasmopara halstedii]|uniref:Uncharacterized protein n=1 Tax=Plasmopara halstedii TaxID=4781 RepID=A0A0P1B3W7_PLAHL|nr:uncharacterized protein PHALS_07215 [Plasmopara halstedii]CEG49452.1 hypothetical protein PHALS_07215 [Plasmopara halstedii]|eukprot:XP_024585821.1 hypothetical protein PHALS_07215 [Plasmopara halstedii]